MSVQPGDGGWGLTMDLAGFKRVPYATLFGSASYLANPKDRNDTTSIAYNISPAAVPPINADGTSYNSVPDQFMARLGGAVPIGKSGFACSFAWRVEGLPRYDVFGESHGFRRPGVEMFLEPGASYARGSHVYSVQIPFGYYRNRFPNPYTGNKGDATFPKYIVLASYGYRFGGASKPDASALRHRSAHGARGHRRGWPQAVHAQDARRRAEDAAERARQGDAGRVLLSDLPVLQRRRAGNPAALRHLQGAGPLGRLHQHRSRRGEARAGMARRASLHRAGAGGSAAG